VRRDPAFWLFAATQVLVLAIGIVLAAMLSDVGPTAWEPVVSGAAVVVALAIDGLLTLSWGGDVMRPHLRRVCPSARTSCPACGHGLQGHLDDAGETVRCPECAAEVPVAMFDAPYRIPRRFRAVSW
jgi:hypothetical protein